MIDENIDFSRVVIIQARLGVIFYISHFIAFILGTWFGVIVLSIILTAVNYRKDIYNCTAS